MGKGSVMPKERETREILRRFRQEGWMEEVGKGSHRVFRKDGITISVPTSKKEVALGTYRNIAKLAGWL